MELIATYQAIQDTGKTLVKLLRENLTPEPVQKPEMIELCSPADENDFILTVYLYSIRENGEAREPTNPRLSLSLYYLLTASSKADSKSKAYDESCIIGKAMEVMNRNAIVRGSDLQGTLSENNEEIRIIFNSFSMDEMSKIWTFPNTPYRLSIPYVVGPVYIDFSGILSEGGSRVLR